MKAVVSRTLTIRSPGGEKWAELVWERGRTRVVSVKADIVGTINELITFGLDEMVGDGADAVPRITPSSSSEFLPRLEEHFARQFPLRLSMKEVVEEEAPLVYSSITVCNDASIGVTITTISNQQPPMMIYSGTPVFAAAASVIEHHPGPATADIRRAAN